MKASHLRENLLQDYYKSAKSILQPSNYRNANSKTTTRKLQFSNIDSPSKFEMKLVDTIQNKKFKVQEFGNEEVSVNRGKNKASKYKGRNKYQRTVQRNSSYSHKILENSLQRKRYIKGEDKIKEEMEESALINKNKHYSNRNTIVKFKNLNSKESLVSRKSTRGARMVEAFSHKSENKPLHFIPPKTEAQKEFDKEWVQDLPKELTQKQKDKLLSLEDQAERNRELSRMTDSGTSGLRSGRSSLAVLRLRKSHVRNKRNFHNYSGQRNKIDEKFNENTIQPQNNQQQKRSNRNTKESHERKENKMSKYDSFQIVSKIRERGEKARLNSLQSTPKSTHKYKGGKRTPLSKDKISPIPFPNFDSDEKEMSSGTKFYIGRKHMTENVGPVQLMKDTEHKNSTGVQNGIKKLEPETNSNSVVDKVQVQNKDISVPLVTEIIKKPLVDSSYEMAARLPPRPVNKLTPTSMGQPKQVVEIIKEQHGNLRSPAKINNRLLLPVEETSMQPLMETDSEFKTPLPKKPRSASKKELNIKKKEVITTFPMRIDFNERPKEFDDIILPRKLQLIFDFFVELDNAINNCKRRGKIPILSNLKQYIEITTKRSFEIDHFRRVYYVSPELYYYTWQTNPENRSQELRIEIPENIEEIITKVHKKSVTVEIKKTPISEPMTNFTINKRKIIMRTRLILYIENLHKNFLHMQGCNTTDYNAVKGWHPSFDLESVMDLQRKTLKNTPKGKKGETISEFLKTKNIKTTLLKREAENNSTKAKSGMHSNSQRTGNNSIGYPSMEKRSPAKIGNGLISPSFYKRIETKEKMYKEEKKNLEMQSKKEEKKRKQELMMKISQAVKSVFSVKGKVSTLFLNHVLKFLNDKQRGNFYSKKELISTLKEISQVVPEWLTLKQHERGFLVKI